jgi:type I restriction-modification system DNA methylase subunit
MENKSAKLQLNNLLKLANDYEVKDPLIEFLPFFVSLITGEEAPEAPYKDELLSIIGKVDIDYLPLLFELMTEKSNILKMSRLGQHYTPKKISQLIYNVAQALNIEYKTVCDPTCGSGALLLPFGAEGAKCYGIEIDETGHQIAQELLTLERIDHHIVLGDSLKSSDKIPTVDLIVMNPPYGGCKKNDYRLYNSLQYCFIHWALNKIEDGSYILAVMPNSFLQNKAKIKDAADIWNDNKLIGYVDFASGVFQNTGAKTTLFIIKKGEPTTEYFGVHLKDDKELKETSAVFDAINKIENERVRYHKYNMDGLLIGTTNKWKMPTLEYIAELEDKLKDLEV